MEQVKTTSRISELAQVILLYKRQYFIDKVKKPLRKAIIILGRRYPRAIKKNINNHNARVILETNEWFLRHDSTPERHEMFEEALNVFACEVEHDHFYRFRIAKYLERLIKNGFDFDLECTDAYWDLEGD